MSSPEHPSADELTVAVRLRDNEQCQACKGTTNLEVHRIVPLPEGRNQMSNYVLLCKRCHQAAHDDSRRSVTGDTDD